MKWQGWIVTADWYDEMGAGYFCGAVHRTRTEAIKKFLENCPDEPASWPRAKREGWRCVKCTVSW